VEQPRCPSAACTLSTTFRHVGLKTIHSVNTHVAEKSANHYMLFTGKRDILNSQRHGYSLELLQSESAGANLTLRLRRSLYFHRERSDPTGNREGFPARSVMDNRSINRLNLLLWKWCVIALANVIAFFFLFKLFLFLLALPTYVLTNLSRFFLSYLRAYTTAGRVSPSLCLRGAELNSGDTSLDFIFP